MARRARSYARPYLSAANFAPSIRHSHGTKVKETARWMTGSGPLALLQPRMRVARPVDEPRCRGMSRAVRTALSVRAALKPVDCGPRILPGYIPGASRQAAHCKPTTTSKHHGFGAIFEAGRLADIGAFLDRYDAQRDGVWLVVDGGRVHGSIVIDGGGRRPDAAQLRWFVVSEELRGRDFGRRLMSAAMDFCRTRFTAVHLHTFAGLNAARRLYERHGFRLVGERPSTEWGPARP